jgi:hypothetical protein
LERSDRVGARIDLGSNVDRTARERRFTAATAAMDKGYDVERVYAWFVDGAEGLPHELYVLPRDRQQYRAGQVARRSGDGIEPSKRRAAPPLLALKTGWASDSYSLSGSH